MKSHNKIDPAVAKIQRATANKTCSLPIHVSVTVGSRVVAFAVVKPKTQGEYLRLKANRTESGSAFTVKADNYEGSLYAQLFLDGKELSLGVEPFGRVITHAMLRINDVVIDKIIPSV